MNKYKVTYTMNGVVKVYDTPCPHKVCYESINYHVMKLVGNEHCRRCKFCKGKEKSGPDVYILCNHPDGCEEQKSSIIIPGRIVKIIRVEDNGNI